MRDFVTSLARVALDWVSLTMISIVRFDPPALNPYLRSSLTCLTTKASDPAKPASGPVCGLTKPILRTSVGPDAAGPWIPQDARRPVAPKAAAPSPADLRKDRRLRPPDTSVDTRTPDSEGTTLS
jgi:hypothetical protein